MSYFKAILVAIAILPSCAYATDVYSCDHVATLDDGRHAVQTDSHVNLTLNGDQVLVELKLPADDSDKTMTFKRCANTRQDQSNFASWFERECRGMESSDGTAASIKRNLVGAYAGISPEVTPAYSMWTALTATSKELGISRPDRTFVLYSSERTPVYEYFCYVNRKL